jgi:geranylgeranyl pyrophosphate synthase
MALEKILQIGNIELVQMFSDTLKVMSEGEILQQFDKFKIPTLKEYIEKTGKKTAKLFETALLGGLLIASKNLLPVYKEAYEFAHNFGIAFQIQNDLINCKTTKSDIKDGIYTAPVILSDNIENINSGIEKTQSLLNNYIDRAENALKNIEENIYLRGLIDLLELMKNG